MGLLTNKILTIAHGEKWWCVGFTTGIDNDLVCVFPNIHFRKQEQDTLSPTCKNLPLAIFAFLIKRILLNLDSNYDESFYLGDIIR